MHSKPLAVILLIALVTLGTMSTVFAQDDVSLIYWDTMNDQERPIMQEIIAECEAETGYTVVYEYVPFSEAQANYRTAAQAGNAPDIMRTEIAWGPEFAALGYLYDLTDLVTEEEAASYLSAAYNYNVWNDRVWGLPQVTDAPALLYNKRIFEEAGLDPENPPQTMEELEEAALAISALSTDDAPVVGIAMLPDVYFFQPFMWAFGGGLIDADDLEIHVTDQGTIDALNFVNQLREEGAMASEYDPANQYNNSMIAFKEGQAGMLINGPWATSDVLTGTEFADNPENLGVAAIPAGPEGQGSPVGGHEYTIYAGSPYPEEALELVRCLNSTEHQVRLATDLNLVPTLLAAYEDPALTENTVLQGFLSQMQVATNRPVIPAGGQIYTEFGPRWTAVMLGEEDPQEAMDTVAAAWQILLDQQPAAQ
jgi:arabinogalactan oligomer / maltooligosaccharide transport system substrate-binding protein